MRILFATDGSPESQGAAALLADLPLETDSTITVAHVREDEELTRDPVLAAAQKALSHATAAVQFLAPVGHPAEEIVEAAERAPADLVVLGSRGHSAVERFFVGSVAERVARHAPCPVLVVRPPVRPLRQVVIGVDSSDASTAAVAWLRGFPLPDDCEVRLVTAVANLYQISHEHFVLMPPIVEQQTSLADWERERAQARLEQLAGELRESGRSVVTELRTGDSASELLDVAETEGADLIVVGSHGLTGLDRFLLGSVSENVLRHAHCSVLIVRAR
jgi:nucleotide-binding universal stress UspA family protein